MDNYIKIGKIDFFRHGKTYIMGILNMTPDSFSDGGSYKDMDRAMDRVREMIAQGADMIDVGGESTRPGHDKISDAKEIARVVPIIKAIKSKFDIPVSVDTYKSAVAKEALAAGADLVNDIWGLKYDAEMAGVIARSGAACCLMHNRESLNYTDFIVDCLDDLKASIDLALKAGIAPEKIIIDPGIGFAKTYEHNLLALKHLDAFQSLGYPVLLGTSRKSVIGLTLKLPVDQRQEGTLVTTVAAVAHACAFVRVHDIKENFRAIAMAEAVKYVREPDESGNGTLKRHRVYIGIGANMGDRGDNIESALHALKAEPGIDFMKCSGIMETKPYGGVEQDDFLNACALLETTKTPQELLKCLNRIEKELGRERIIHWGPRTIDLDILLYDDIIVDDENLKIPHIDMQNREFVLKPLAEIAGHVRHPSLHQTIHQLYIDLFRGEL